MSPHEGQDHQALQKTKNEGEMAAEQISPVNLLLISVAILCLAISSSALPFSSTSSSRAAIVNGTSVIVGLMQDTFVYCKALVAARDIHRCQVMWLDYKGDPVPPWSRRANVFSLGRGDILPYSYLVFHDFTRRNAGNYSCVLSLEGKRIHSSTIAVEGSLGPPG